MPNEMDLLRMDERQRLAWLMANRGTLIVVGLAWIGLIIRELAAGRMPLLLIVMVPVFALLRAALFFFYSSTSIAPSGRSPARPGAWLLKAGAAALLWLSLFLPLYAFARVPAGGARVGFMWDLLRDDLMILPLLAVAFGWPAATLAVSRFTSRRWLTMVNHIAEPLLATVSVLILLWIPQFHWEARTLWIFFLGFESAQPAAGTYVAVTANGLYFVAWLWDLLRP